jgi:hypothetical protein
MYRRIAVGDNRIQSESLYFNEQYANQDFVVYNSYWVGSTESIENISILRTVYGQNSQNRKTLYIIARDINFTWSLLTFKKLNPLLTNFE